MRNPHRLTRSSYRRNRERGLTLVELMVVVSILALLASVIGIAVFQHFKKAKIEAASIAAHNLRAAAQLHTVDHPEDPSCPTPSTMMEAREIDSTTSLDDPWATAYRIECTVDEVTASSAGPDRAFGTDDDIRVPGPRRRAAGVATHP